ncbi:MAG TPA: YdcH family protein [Burkholderiaceae bacterium]|nr:YdcH family protein [Burkholderiaceae bacterium]
MTVPHHPLLAEFPELREQLHARKQTDRHLARLADEYEALDKRIVRIENGNEALPDASLEDLKKQRLLLKDQLYALLTAAAGA